MIGFWAERLGEESYWYGGDIKGAQISDMGERRISMDLNRCNRTSIGTLDAYKPGQLS